jgi:hypothetical protein
MQTDAFAQNLSVLEGKTSWDFQTVRRPYRGIEIKEDTYSVIKVIRSNGQDIPLVDAGSRVGMYSVGTKPLVGTKDTYDPPPEGTTFNYSNFIAQRIVESRSEKQQIVETFGEPFIFFFGEKPRVLSVQGLLMNTLDFNWKNEFWKNYETYLRGTRLVQLDARIYLYYDDQIVEGYMLDAQATHDSTLPYHVPFSFTLFVTAHTYMGLSADVGNYPVGANVQVPVDNLVDRQNFDQVVKGLRLKMDKARSQRALVSSIEDVRRAAYNAAGGVVGKQAIVSAMIRGLSDYEARTQAFLANIKTYFYGRRTVVPGGVAGAERLAGPAQYANAAISPATPPSRQLPLRSKISDNVDEYTGGGDAELSTALMAELSTTESLDVDSWEIRLLSDMEKLGVDTSKPSAAQNWRANMTHSLTKTANKIDFAAGIAQGVQGTLTAKAEQAAQVAGSLPGVAAAAATPPTPTIPGVVPPSGLPGIP